jgi:hypothetical protein
MVAKLRPQWSRHAAGSAAPRHQAGNHRPARRRDPLRPRARRPRRSADQQRGGQGNRERHPPHDGQRPGAQDPRHSRQGGRHGGLGRRRHEGPCRGARRRRGARGTALGHGGERRPGVWRPHQRESSWRRGYRRNPCCTPACGRNKLRRIGPATSQQRAVSASVIETERRNAYAFCALRP